MYASLEVWRETVRYVAHPVIFIFTYIMTSDGIQMGVYGNDINTDSDFLI